MAVLEAFVYDPLLNWRLMETTPAVNVSAAAQAGGGQQQQPVQRERSRNPTAAHRNQGESSCFPKLLKDFS